MEDILNFWREPNGELWVDHRTEGKRQATAEEEQAITEANPWV